MQSLLDFVALLEKVLRQAHLTFEARGDLSRYTHTNGIRVETQGAQEKHLTSERIRSEQQEVRYFPKLRAYTGVLLEEQRKQMLSEAKSGKFVQESRAERADDAIHELNRPLKSGI